MADKVSSTELVGRLLSLAVFNNATRSLLPEREFDDELPDVVSTKIVYETGLLTLFVTTTACLVHPIFKSKQDAENFVDELQFGYYSLIYNSDIEKMKQISIDFENRYELYSEIVDKINNNLGNEKYVIDLDVMFNKLVGINEGLDEIKARVSQDNNWYTFMHIQLHRANEILDKYDEIDFDHKANKQ